MKWRSFSTLALAALSASLAVTAARADDGPWEVRLRGVYLDPANKSDAVPALAVPSNAIHVNSRVLPDVDFEYFFTPNWSAELILTYPQTQTVTVEKSALGGPTGIGTFKHLPPFITAKYDILPGQDFQPYVGVGVNVTLIYDDNLVIPTVGKLYMSNWSVGPAAQVGFDYKIANHWYLNADIKWALLSSKLDLAGAGRASTAHIDPFLFGLGIGYRFGGHPAAVAAAPVAAPPPPPPPSPAPPPPPVAASPPPCTAPAGFKVDADCRIIEQSVIVRAVDFEYNSSQLTAPAQQTLNEVASALLTQPELNVEVQGHSDSIGSAAYNLSLSQRRADAVKAYLISKGVNASTLTAKGYGKTKPIFSNETAEGRTQNRRVEFEVTNGAAHVHVVNQGASAASTEAAGQGQQPRMKKGHP